VVPEKRLITSFPTDWDMLLWKLNYSPNPPSSLNAEICFPSSVTLVQKHVVASVLKFKPEAFTPSSHGFCHFKKIKTKAEIVDACRQMRIFVIL